MNNSRRNNRKNNRNRGEGFAIETGKRRNQEKRT
jgi:hypothetical protein